MKIQEQDLMYRLGRRQAHDGCRARPLCQPGRRPTSYSARTRRVARSITEMLPLCRLAVSNRPPSISATAIGRRMRAVSRLRDRAVRRSVVTIARPAREQGWYQEYPERSRDGSGYRFHVGLVCRIWLSSKTLQPRAENLDGLRQGQHHSRGRQCCLRAEHRSAAGSASVLRDGHCVG